MEIPRRIRREKERIRVQTMRLPEKRRCRMRRAWTGHSRITCRRRKRRWQKRKKRRWRQMLPMPSRSLNRREKRMRMP